MKESIPLLLPPFPLPLPLLLPLLLPPLLPLLLPLLPLQLQLGQLHLPLRHPREIRVLRVSCLGALRTILAIWILALPSNLPSFLSKIFRGILSIRPPSRLHTTFACLRMFLCQFCVHIWSTCESWVGIFLLVLQGPSLSSWPSV